MSGAVELQALAQAIAAELQALRWESDCWDRYTHLASQLEAIEAQPGGARSRATADLESRLHAADRVWAAATELRELATATREALQREAAS